MSQLEGWMITLLGMSVVFAGLVMCIAAIELFNRLARFIRWDGAHGAPAPAQSPEAPETPPAAPDPAPAAVVPPEILAVIAAALEAERRLYLAGLGHRVTLRGPNA